ncbi:MAG: hypothetical protein PVG51_00435 [Desulfosarcina sp.]|jgi:hypothetical protein
MSTKAVFIETVKAKVEAWKDDVERLQSDAARIGKSDMAEFTATIQKILAMIQQIEMEFTASLPDHADTWQELIRRAKASFNDLEARVDAAKKKYLP